MLIRSPVRLVPRNALSSNDCSQGHILLPCHVSIYVQLGIDWTLLMFKAVSTVMIVV